MDHRDGFNKQIFAQKVNSAGTPQWADNGVCAFSGDSYIYSHGIASDGASGAIITWIDLADNNVYARRIGSDGNPMWAGPTQITDTGDFMGLLRSPRKTVEDGAGGAITVWLNDSDEIFAQRVDGAGNTLWAENGSLLCDADTIEGPGCPRLAACDTNCGATGALAYWNEYRNEETGQDIYMQGVGPNGNLGRPCPVCAPPVPVGGEAYPVNKVNLLMPLIAIGIAVLAGATIAWRRRSSAS